MYSGSLDGCAEAIIHGWAINTAEPQSVKLTLFEGAQPVLSFFADRFREDLYSIGQSHGFCGFRIAVPAMLADGKPHDLSIRFDDGSILPNGSFTYSYSSELVAGRLHIDSCQALQLTGWAHCHRQRIDSIQIVVSGEEQTATFARIYRPDVRDHFLVSDAYLGFQVHLPSSIFLRNAPAPFVGEVTVRGKATDGTQTLDYKVAIDYELQLGQLKNSCINLESPNIPQLSDHVTNQSLVGLTDGDKSAFQFRQMLLRTGTVNGEQECPFVLKALLSSPALQSEERKQLYESPQLLAEISCASEHTRGVGFRHVSEKLLEIARTNEGKFGATLFALAAIELYIADGAIGQESPNALRLLLLKVTNLRSSALTRRLGEQLLFSPALIDSSSLVQTLAEAVVQVGERAFATKFVAICTNTLSHLSYDILDKVLRLADKSAAFTPTTQDPIEKLAHKLKPLRHLGLGTAQDEASERDLENIRRQLSAEGLGLLINVPEYSSQLKISFASEIDALLHYLKMGWRVSPLPRFSYSSAFLRQQLFSVGAPNCRSSLLSVYLAHESSLDIGPTPLFCPKLYAEEANLSCDQSAWLHFLNNAAFEDYCGSGIPMFHKDYFLQRGGIRHKGMNSFLSYHFFFHRSPCNPYFHEGHYSARVGRSTDTGPLLVHFLTSGRFQGIEPSPFARDRSPYFSHTISNLSRKSSRRLTGTNGGNP